MLSVCGNCVHFKRNHPQTPIFIKGLWWGGPDAGLCKRWSQDYNTNQHRVDTDCCDQWESDKPDLVTFKGVNCPKCGRFMSKDEELQEWTIEHSHDTEGGIPITHTHPIFTETWRCGCGAFEHVEIDRDYHNTFENPEPW